MAHRNEHAVEIERPPDAVFPWLYLPDRRLRWMQVLVRAEQVDDGEVGLGTRFRDAFEERGHRFDLDTEIVEWEPGRQLATSIRSNGFTSTARQSLEDLGGRTRLTTTLETEYTSRLAKLMAGVVTSHAQKQLERDMTLLKELVESEPA
jgi:uncharacterized protein YndB with AHSA1/START domain